MKKTLRISITVILILAILLCSVWYLFVYDRDFTRDMLLTCARKCENNGNHSAAAWFYDLAYAQSDNSDAVAIELAEQYKHSGNYTKAEYTLYNAISDGGGVDLYIALCKLYVEQDKLFDAVNMLNSVADTTIKAQLDALRPAMPTATTDAAPGENAYYNQYINVTLTSSDTTYFTVDGEYPSTQNAVYSDPIKLPGGTTKIQAIAINSTGLVSQLATYSYTVVDVIELVNFNDAAIEAAIRTILNVDENTDIYTSDLWSISEFTVPADAKSYADLSRLAFLQKLTIENGVKEELAHIIELSNLTHISIIGTDVSSDVLEGIAQFPLQELTLSKCNIYNITALKDTVSLTVLDLSNNSISKIDSLSALVNLTKLDLHYNNISDLSALTTNTKLEILDISQNALTSLVPLVTLKNLKKLDASYNNISDLGNITELTNLSHLVLSNNELTDLVQLASHPTVETLNISGNLLTDISPLATLPELKYLDFSYNQVSALPLFDKECELITIVGVRNNLTSLENLSGLKNLNVVNVEYNSQIKSVTPLATCPILFEVYVYGTAVTDVELLKIQGIVVNFNPLTS